MARNRREFGGGSGAVDGEAGAAEAGEQLVAVVVVASFEREAHQGVAEAEPDAGAVVLDRQDVGAQSGDGGTERGELAGPVGEDDGEHEVAPSGGQAML